MKFTNKEKRVWKNRMLGTVATVGLMGTMLTGTGIALADDILGNNGVMNATTTARARVNLPYENAEKLVNTAGTTVVSNNTVIPSDYSFFIKFIKGKTTVETIGNGWEPFVTPDSSNDPKAYAISEKNIVKGQTGVRYNHVSVFGKDVDVTMTVDDFTGTKYGDGGIAFNKVSQVGAYENRLQNATFTFRFYQSGTNTPIKLTGFHTFSDIDWGQYIRLAPNTLNSISEILADPTCKLVAQKEADGSLTIADPHNTGSNDFDIDAMFTLLFRDLSEFTVTFGSAGVTWDNPAPENDYSWAWFGNTAVKPARSEAPVPAKTVSDSNETTVTSNTLDSMREGFTYQISQMIPGELPQFFYKNVEIMDTVIPELEITSPIKVTDETGTDRTSWFTNSSKGNQIHLQATAEALQTQAFYGHAYTVTFDTQVREGANLLAYLQEDGKYHFPNQAKTIVDGKEQVTGKTDTIVNEIDTTPDKKVLDKEGNEQSLANFEKGDTVKYVVSGTAPYSASGQTFTLEDDFQDVIDQKQELFKLEVEEPDGTWKDVTSEGKIVFDESTEKLSWQLADGSILAGKNYRATFGGTLKEDGDYGQFVTEDGKIMIPNVAKQIVGTQEKETPQADVEVPDIDQTPVKSVLDKNGKETELTSGKKGEKVSFTVKNTAPYASKGQSVTLSDDLENVLDLQEKEVKVEVKNGDQWEDITSQGTFTNNAEEEIVSWTLADGSVLAGKEYRMTITGTLKKDVDYSAYMDKTGNILIPNIAKETIGTKEKATNQVQVAVQQEKPTLLPATGVRQTKESNVLPVFASASVLSLAGYFFVKGRR